MSTLKTTNLQNPSAANPAIVLAADGSATANLSSLNGGQLAGTRNRIINGDMRIDQRNAGASVTATTGVSYVLDRWATQWSATSKFSVQQNAGSVTPPAGFKNYQGLTSLSAFAVGSTDFFGIAQPIEGFNAEDLDWGTASAKTVTLSFWVRSSLTGTFGGSIRNFASNYSYPFTYSIGSANTWTLISVTIAGPTAGTWGTGASGWGSVIFGIGVGSTYSGTAGSWSGNNFLSANGATSVVGTNGATFYITGVQLEPGTVATPFERRSYGQELALCQRYYSFLNNIILFRAATTGNFSGGVTSGALPQTMRSGPTATKNVNAGTYDNASVSTTPNSFRVAFSGGTGVGDYCDYNLFFNAEL